MMQIQFIHRELRKLIKFKIELIGVINDNPEKNVQL